MADSGYQYVGPAVGEWFPGLQFPDADGRLVDLHVWLRGRRALVVFFRSVRW